ncbi:MAG: 16S rRNA (guanine(527)-N(7))-methyltransferase RsmG [Parasphingopyxis sp.]
MDRAEVFHWLGDTHDVPRETLDRLDRYVAMLGEENTRQNLIARSTVPDIWDRHIRDSAQLLELAPPDKRGGRWLDLGSGPGLPGIVLALIGEMRMTLVESRRRRAEFLERAVDELALGGRVTVEGMRLQRVAPFPADVIAARAFASLPKLFALALPFARKSTLWLLPKGKSVEDELAEARRLWQGRFETVQSATDPASFIVCASAVSRKDNR